ncbi:unnamed protein product [Pleuronectes platessa]|uniref:Uncharacterized protein n=1 Tax=Pleuronectes platessa TaxID=8262 RepID=A0A9N7Z9W9_PLEPL|nr:unnamed protein product [Pleuronectes platessa]
MRKQRHRVVEQGNSRMGGARTLCSVQWVGASRPSSLESGGFRTRMRSSASLLQLRLSGLCQAMHALRCDQGPRLLTSKAPLFLLLLLFLLLFLSPSLHPPPPPRTWRRCPDARSRGADERSRIKEKKKKKKPQSPVPLPSLNVGAENLGHGDTSDPSVNVTGPQRPGPAAHWPRTSPPTLFCCLLADASVSRHLAQAQAESFPEPTERSRASWCQSCVLTGCQSDQFPQFNQFNLTSCSVIIPRASYGAGAGDEGERLEWLTSLRADQGRLSAAQSEQLIGSQLLLRDTGCGSEGSRLI